MADIVVKNWASFTLPDRLTSWIEWLEEAIKGRERQVAFLVVLAGVHLYYRRKHSYWARRNVKTPWPLPVLGNLHSFLLRPRQELQLEWPKSYGKLYGFYMGTRPYLVCADAQLLKQICVKDFDKFPNHQMVPLRNKYQDHFLIFQEDDHWRSMRAILSPTFSSGKIKTLHRALEACTEDLVQECRSRCGQVLELKPLFGQYSMSCALRGFYGLEPRSEGDSSKSGGGGEFSKAELARRSALALNQSTFRVALTSLLPLRLLKLLKFSQIPESNFDFFAHTAERIIKRRQTLAGSRRFNDYLQLILEAKADDSSREADLAQSDLAESHHAADIDAKLESWRPSRMRLNEMEVSCQAMMLMLVATETSSTLITHTVFLLAHHPRVQRHLREALAKLDKLDYEQLSSCVYLDCVISESLRLMPPALFMDRVAGEDYHIPDYNVLVPRGTSIYLDFFAILHDPDYWPEPQLFQPDRFKPENKANIVPGSYCPFGIGPRACIGFRFALTEAKTALARLMSEFWFEPAPNSVFPAQPARLSFILNANKNMTVIMRPH